VWRLRNGTTMYNWISLKMEIPQSRCFNGKNNDKIDGYTYLYISIDMKIYKMDMYQYIYTYIIIYICSYIWWEREIYIYILYHIWERTFSNRPNWLEPSSSGPFSWTLKTPSAQNVQFGKPNNKPCSSRTDQHNPHKLGYWDDLSLGLPHDSRSFRGKTCLAQEIGEIT
jgi:hypothetical protein